MFVRLLKHWNGCKPGRILNMPDGAANALLHRPGGFAERVEGPKQAAKPETKKAKR